MATGYSGGRMVAHNMVTTQFELDGFRVTRTLGVVRGIVVRSRSIFGTIGAGLQTLVGGNITLLTNLCEKTRQEAFDLMLQHAAELGGNAVLAARYDATEVMQGVTEVLAYGTAVYVEPADVSYSQAQRSPEHCIIVMSSLPELPTIREAQHLLAKYFPPTPFVKAPSLSGARAEVYLKIETGLPTGSFKPRGAMYALSKNLQRRHIDEVIASSTGNHGAATAFAARTLGVSATIFLPEQANPVKRKKIEDLGARIVCHGNVDLAGAFQMASEYSRRPGVYFLNDATDPDLPAGPATIGLEILQQLPELSAVLVPMGYIRVYPRCRLRD